MPYKVTYKNESLAKGTIVIVDGLGELVNGEPVLVSDEAAADFEIRNQVIETKHTKNGLEINTRIVEFEDHFAKNGQISVVKVNAASSAKPEEKSKEGEK